MYHERLNNNCKHIRLQFGPIKDQLVIHVTTMKFAKVLILKEYVETSVCSIDMLVSSLFIVFHTHNKLLHIESDEIYKHHLQVMMECCSIDMGCWGWKLWSHHVCHKVELSVEINIQINIWVRSRCGELWCLFIFFSLLEYIESKSNGWNYYTCIVKK
jgi:hypothetical protein